MEFLEKKKGQMKIQQMAFMLMAVTLFFVLAGLFVFSILFSNIKTSAKNLEQENTILLVSKIANSPEFSCETAFGGNRLSCIDADKAMALSNNINKYKNFWGVEEIEIRKIYPPTDLPCTWANYPKCGKIEVLSSENGGTGISNFVALCRKENIEDKIEDICELAKIIVVYDG